MPEPEPDELPGLPQRYLPLIIVMPLLLLAVVLFGSYVPFVPPGVLLIGAFVLPAMMWIVIAVRDDRRKRRKAGLIPKREGFSAEVELLAAKLRERADAVENASRFGNRVHLPFTLQSYLDKVRRTASETDHHQIVPRLDLTISLVEPSDYEMHATKLRAAAMELDAYAEEVRKRGGIYHVNPKQRAGCFAFISLVFLGGVYLIWISQVWWGVAVLAITAFGLWAAIGSQSELA